jgi:hypothetical protein
MERYDFTGVDVRLQMRFRNPNGSVGDPHVAHPAYANLGVDERSADVQYAADFLNGQ